MKFFETKEEKEEREEKEILQKSNYWIAKGKKGSDLENTPKSDLWKLFK